MKKLFVFILFCISITANSNVKVAVIYNTGGLGDRSHNDLVHKGLIEAKKNLGINFDYYEPLDPAIEVENQLITYAESGDYELILTVGFSLEDSLIKIAPKYPEQKFAIIDEVIYDIENITSITFNVEDESFLAGVVAGLVTKTNKTGFIGGVEAPLINKYKSGFEQGVRYINPDIKVLVSYIGGYNAFNDNELAERKTDKLIKKNADVFYHASGASGQGVVRSAGKHGKYVIGVDSNQNWLDENVVIASAVKKVDVAVYDIMKKLKDNTIKSKVYVYGLEEGGVGLIIGKELNIGMENIKRIREIESGKVKIYHEDRSRMNHAIE